MAEIELHPGTPYCDVATLNRIARQQGLCLAIAQACTYDEICQAVSLPEEDVTALTRAYLERQELDPDDGEACACLLYTSDAADE